MHPRSTTSLLALAIGFGVSVAGGQTVVYVDDDAPLGGDGASWETARTYLQDALIGATPGTEIHVAQGIYRPDQDEASNVTPGDREATFRLISGVEAFGGYRGLAGGGNGDDRDTALFETILSGDLNADDHSGGDNTENSYHVATGSGASATAVLSGFTITAGNADGPDTYPLFPNRGGGMYNYRGSPTVMNCIFSNNNAALGGGGLNNEQGNPTLINCVFRGNTALFSGGGMRGWESGPTLFNCAFTGNTAEFGGVAWHGASTAAYTNCTFSSNSAPLGNALGFDSCCPQQPSNVTLTNCVLWDGGNEIRNFDGSTITITYSDVQDADPNDGSVYPGLGNIDDDPRFVDADGADDVPGTGDENLRLMPGSPCSDAGDNTAVPSDIADLDGDGDTAERTPLDLSASPRFIDDPDTVDTGVPDPPDYLEIVDMGAYEYQECDDSSDCDDGNVCTADLCEAGVCFHQVAPAGTPCGDTTDAVCDHADTCDGLGVCQANFEADGTPCPDGGYCNGEETCDGAGTCQPGAPVVCPQVECADMCNEEQQSCYRPAGLPCGYPDDTDCDNPDTCDGMGGCLENKEPEGTACTDDGDRCTDDFCVNKACTHPRWPDDHQNACGACCYATAGKCFDDLLEEECHGDVWAVNDFCANRDITCEKVIIPTISEPGLLVASVLLLVGIAVKFGRRRPVRE